MVVSALRLSQRRWYWAVVVLLVGLQAGLALRMVHRESLTWDEDDHMFAGYEMWKRADYGLNPEHPPLVKLLATVPALGRSMWMPPQQGRFFKTEAYLGGRDWLARNDGPGQHLVFRMRSAAELLALGLVVVVFFAAREWFGDVAGLVALVLIVFDPTVLANSALVTTDIAVSLFFVGTVYAFYRYVKRPGAGRLVIAAVVLGLLLASKHSGVLVGPMLLLLAGWEVIAARREERGAVAGRMVLALAAMTVVSVLVLWSFYGFRYAARPAGLQMSTSLTEYASPLKPLYRGLVLLIARLHLLPESYLMGLVDVKRMAEGYPMFLLGRVHAHGVWYYFPLVLLIKTTLGLIALLLLAGVAAAMRRLPARRELVYAVVPPLVYLLFAMGSGMNIGSRHLLPVYTFAFIVAAAGAAALMPVSRGWRVACVVLVGLHVLSSMHVYPVEMAYANEAWGGPENAHNLLSDASVDWAQQLLQVKAWQDRHPGEECWFAYFAFPEVLPSNYGIHCHALPTFDSGGTDAAELVPAHFHGTLLVSAGDLSGCEWPTGMVNPYRSLQARKPDETIDYAVFVYRGDFDLPDAAALARVQHAAVLLTAGRKAEALQLAREAVAIAPGNVYAQTTLGDAASAIGENVQARAAYASAVQGVKSFAAEAQPSYLPDLQAKLAKVGGAGV